MSVSKPFATYNDFVKKHKLKKIVGYDTSDDVNFDFSNFYVKRVMNQFDEVFSIGDVIMYFMNGEYCKSKIIGFGAYDDSYFGAIVSVGKGVSRYVDLQDDDVLNCTDVKQYSDMFEGAWGYAIRCGFVWRDTSGSLVNGNIIVSVNDTDEDYYDVACTNGAVIAKRQSDNTVITIIDNALALCGGNVCRLSNDDIKALKTLVL